MEKYTKKWEYNRLEKLRGNLAYVSGNLANVRINLERQKNLNNKDIFAIKKIIQAENLIDKAYYKIYEI